MHLSFKICDLNIFKISLNCAAPVLICLTKGRQGYKILFLAIFSDPGKTLLLHRCCCHHPGFSGKSISHTWKVSWKLLLQFFMRKFLLHALNGKSKLMSTFVSKTRMKLSEKGKFSIKSLSGLHLKPKKF